jgi:pilus assembly protein TadC
VVTAAAGLTVPLAVHAVAERAPPPWGRPLRAAWAAVGRGTLVVDALAGVRDAVGDHAAPLVAVLRDADRDGSALLPTLQRVAVDARDLRRRRAEEAARRVPVRLLFPLVACTLPAFALLTVAPLLVGALRSIQL